MRPLVLRRDLIWFDPGGATMRRYMPFLIAGAIAVFLLAGWYLFVFQSQGNGLKKEQERLQAAESKTQQLNSTIARREELKKRETQTRAASVEFKQNVPDSPDLAEFIWANYDIARQAGIVWTSIQPSVPTAPKTGTGTVPEIQMKIGITGGYFQTLDYLIRLEKLRRTVVVDKINITSQKDTTALTTQLQARMFTTKTGLPWTPSDSDLALIYPQNGPTQRGQIPGPPESGCTPPQPGFSEGQQPNSLGNCSGQLYAPRAGAPLPQAPAGVGVPSPAGTAGPTGPGPQASGGGESGFTGGRSGP